MKMHMLSSLMRHDQMTRIPAFLLPMIPFIGQVRALSV